MKKIYLQLIMLSVCCFFCAKTFAQKTVTGTVVSDSLKVLAGVTVEVQGTTVATLTDQDGKYAISAGDEAILVFKFQGYAAQEIPTHGRTQIDVVLQRNKIVENSYLFWPGLQLSGNIISDPAYQVSGL
jgi:hypothetical protein